MPDADEMRPQSWLGSSNANKEGNSKLEVMGAHDALPPLSVGPKYPAVKEELQGLQCPHQAGLSELSRPAVQADWRCQACGHSCPSIESCHIYCSSIARNAFLLEEPFRMMPHSPSIAEQRLLPSVFQDVFPKERAINSQHQNPVLSQISTCPSL